MHRPGIRPNFPFLEFCERIQSGKGVSSDMQSSKSFIQLTDHQKRIIAKSLILLARNIRNHYEAEMYTWLAKKMMSMERSVGLDGQELVMISFALNKEADRCRSKTVAQVYRTLSQQIAEEKKKFHIEAYEELAARYLV
jgi:hypothetical protein